MPSDFLSYIYWNKNVQTMLKESLKGMFLKLIIRSFQFRLTVPELDIGSIRSSSHKVE